jgi:hypothetical protein
VELTTSPGNDASQKVILACGDRLLERFVETAAYGSVEGLRSQDALGRQGRLQRLKLEAPSARNASISRAWRLTPAGGNRFGELANLPARSGSGEAARRTIDWETCLKAPTEIALELQGMRGPAALAIVARGQREDGLGE